MCTWLWLAGWLFQKKMTYISSIAWPWFLLVALRGAPPHPLLWVHAWERRLYPRKIQQGDRLRKVEGINQYCIIRFEENEASTWTQPSGEQKGIQQDWEAGSRIRTGVRNRWEKPWEERLCTEHVCGGSPSRQFEVLLQFGLEGLKEMDRTLTKWGFCEQT